MTGASRFFGITFIPFVLLFPTSLPFTLAVVSGIYSFGRGDYVILEHGVLVSSLEQLVNGCGGMQRQQINKLGIRANSLFHCLQDNVRTYDIKLEDRDSKMFHKVINGLGSPHPEVDKTSDALLSLD